MKVFLVFHEVATSRPVCVSLDHIVSIVPYTDEEDGQEHTQIFLDIDNRVIPVIEDFSEVMNSLMSVGGDAVYD